jgi:hypothetical protein
MANNRHLSLKPYSQANLAITAAFFIGGAKFLYRQAKIVFSAVVGDARNKVGGVVFTKSRAGSVVRRKVSPVQPRTTAQSAVRASFTGFSKVWSGTLTSAQRAAWIALAKGTPVKDVFGASIILTGLQLFQQLNRSLATIGVAQILTPPVTLVAEEAGNATIVANHTGPVLSILPSTFNTGVSDWVIRASPPVSPGKVFIGSKLVVVKFGSTVLAAAQTFATEYIAKFGALQVGQQIFASITYVNNTSGAQGRPAQSQTIVI